MILLILLSMQTVYDSVIENVKNRMLERYDKDIPPMMQLIVGIEYHTVGIITFDSVSEVLSSVGVAILRWPDPRLAWRQHVNDTYRFVSDSIQYISISQHDIWLPNILVRNSVKDMKRQGGRYPGSVKVLSEGYIVWNIFRQLSTVCTIDVQYYPFDIQICTLTFVAWGETLNSVRLMIITQDIAGNIKDQKENGEWEMSEGSYIANNTVTESKMEVTLFLRRKWLNVCMSSLLPIAMLSFLSTFAFLIPSEVGERVWYSITIFLSCVVLLSMVADRLPKSAEQVPNLGKYLIVLVIQSCIAVVLSVIELRIVSTDAVVPNTMTSLINALTNCINYVQMIRRKSIFDKVIKSQSEITTVVGGEDNEKNAFRESGADYNDDINASKVIISKRRQKAINTAGWRQVCIGIDFVAFWVSLITNIVCTTLFFVSGFRSANCDLPGK